MKRLFIDTNILLDIFLEREPFVKPAQILWSLVEQKKVRGAVSALSFNNIFFIIRKLGSMDKAYRALQSMKDTFFVTDVTTKIISKALEARHSDFEDAIQYYSALKFRADAILSRDPTGFRESKIPIMDCNEYLTLKES